MQVAVREYIGENAITREAGRALYERIHPALLRGEAVCLDFEGVKVLASPFLNAAIGQLYRDLTSEQLNKRLKVGNMMRAGQDTLRVVIGTAKAAYADTGNRQAVQDAITEELVAEA